MPLGMSPVLPLPGASELLRQLSMTWEPSLGSVLRHGAFCETCLEQLPSSIARGSRILTVHGHSASMCSALLRDTAAATGLCDLPRECSPRSTRLAAQRLTQLESTSPGQSPERIRT